MTYSKSIQQPRSRKREFRTTYIWSFPLLEFCQVTSKEGQQGMEGKVLGKSMLEEICHCTKAGKPRDSIKQLIGQRQQNKKQEKKLKTYGSQDWNSPG